MFYSSMSFIKAFHDVELLQVSQMKVLIVPGVSELADSQ
jgi:hypothetical protein